MEARCYIYVYAQEDSHDETLLKFAVLDFNLLQKLYQGELVTITKWWRKIKFTEKLPFCKKQDGGMLLLGIRLILRASTLPS